MEGKPPGKISKSELSVSERIPVHLEEENLYRDKIARELRNGSPPQGAFEPTQPPKHQGTDMLTIGSTIEGISQSNPNLFVHRFSRYSDPMTKVDRHSPDSSVSGEIEVSENEVSENPLEKETPASDPLSLTVTGTKKKD